MLALLAILIGALVGVALGGRLSGLADLGLRRLRWLGAGFAALATLQLGPDVLREGAAHRLLLAASYVAVIAFLWQNRSVRAIRVVGVGVLLNLLTIVPNGGMPVSLHAARRAGLPDPIANPGLLGGKHVIAGPETKLSALGDVLPVPLPPFRQAISVGDIVVLAGIGWLTTSATLRAKRPTPVG